MPNLYAGRFPAVVNDEQLLPFPLLKTGQRLSAVSDVSDVETEVELEVERVVPTKSLLSRDLVLDHVFVSNVRFLAMIAIVWVHAELMWGYYAGSAAYLQVVLLQLMKFGTIDFFLISGFLLGEGLTRSSPLQYFRRRVKAVFQPWVFWGCVWFGIALSESLIKVGGHALAGSSLRVIVVQYFRFVFTESIYWFVPNFFVCLAIVLALHRRVSDVVQGLLFLAFSLFYAVNAYIAVIPPFHTAALFGFVFYLWLGAFAYTHRARWSRWLDGVPWWKLILYTTVAATTAVLEFHVLQTRNSLDPHNTLRLSNQVFSVLVALLIVKCKRTLYPSYIKVRMETFGIFLIHPILMALVDIGVKPISKGTKSLFYSNGPISLCLEVVSFCVLYFGALIATKVLRTVPLLAWTVGG
ncbi:acyltransferase [Granulicella sp. dw_53]|uniref:acyltransferase family protein n=1 Tax=Granulicella sp. dw_53 TaxID=2719792 RepID=UPI001BD1E9AA|nr:acyltransferase [Granulicella sp. dw_53]